MQTRRPMQRKPLRVKRAAEAVDPLSATAPPPGDEERFNALVDRAVERGYIDLQSVLALRELGGKWDSWHLHQQFAERMRKKEFAQRKPWPQTIITKSDGSVTVVENQT